MLEVNPESETKLSGFTAVSGGWGGSPVLGFRGLGARFQVSGFKFQVSSFKFQVPRYFVPLR